LSATVNFLMHFTCLGYLILDFIIITGLCETSNLLSCLLCNCLFSSYFLSLRSKYSVCISCMWVLSMCFFPQTQKTRFHILIIQWIYL
jgi:hypothetical protein